MWSESSSPKVRFLTFHPRIDLARIQPLKGVFLAPPKSMTRIRRTVPPASVFRA